MSPNWGSACSWPPPPSPFSRTVRYEFVAYDDNVYVYANRHVKGGLTLEDIRWAFTQVHSSNWHPLTWLSHMLDWELYGPRPGGHHLTNVLLHAAACVVLFLALRRLTGAVWRSGIVAALFALHPLHVESVAWVSERKDVLSGLFFGLTLWAYAGYVGKTRWSSGFSRQDARWSSGFSREDARWSSGFSREDPPKGGTAARPPKGGTPARPPKGGTPSAEPGICSWWCSSRWDCSPSRCW